MIVKPRNFAPSAPNQMPYGPASIIGAVSWRTGTDVVQFAPAARAGLVFEVKRHLEAWQRGR